MIIVSSNPAEVKVISILEYLKLNKKMIKAIIEIAILVYSFSNDSHLTGVVKRRNKIY